MRFCTWLIVFKATLLSNWKFSRTLTRPRMERFEINSTPIVSVRSKYRRMPWAPKRPVINRSGDGSEPLGWLRSVRRPALAVGKYVNQNGSHGDREKYCL